MAEGLEKGRVVLPRGAAEGDAIWRVIMDPIDGTRGLMYQKRSARILTGVAPNLGPDTGPRSSPAPRQGPRPSAICAWRGAGNDPYGLRTYVVTLRGGSASAKAFRATKAMSAARTGGAAAVTR